MQLARRPPEFSWRPSHEYELFPGRSMGGETREGVLVCRRGLQRLKGRGGLRYYGLSAYVR